MLTAMKHQYETYSLWIASTSGLSHVALRWHWALATLGPATLGFSLCRYQGTTFSRAVDRQQTGLQPLRTLVPRAFVIVMKRRMRTMSLPVMDFKTIRFLGRAQ